MRPVVSIDNDVKRQLTFESVEVHDNSASGGEKALFLSTFNELSDPVYNAVNDGNFHSLKITRGAQEQVFAKVLVRGMTRTYRDDYVADSINFLIMQ